MKSKVSITRCASYDPPLVQEAVRKAVDLIGGIAEFVKPGSRVLVKPNLLMAKGPESGICTHPEVVRAVIKILKETGCKVSLGDGPSVWGNRIKNIDQLYEITGMTRVCREEGIELIRFDRRRWRGKFPITTRLDECDYLVNVPKLKTHQLTLMTCAIKNLFGLVSGTYKTELHKQYFEKAEFCKILVDIFQEVKPALTVVDAVVAMEGDGPGSEGKLRDLNMVFAGADCVALDSVVALIMGIKPQDVLTTKEAALRGLGVADIDSIAVLGESLADAAGRPFQLPTSSFKSKLPPELVRLAKKLIRYYPCVERDHCIRCATCIRACPNKAIEMKKKGIVIDYKKRISCFCCQETCPNSAIKIKKSIFAKIVGL